MVLRGKVEKRLRDQNATRRAVDSHALLDGLLRPGAKTYKSSVAANEKADQYCLLCSVGYLRFGSVVRQLKRMN